MRRGIKKKFKLPLFIGKVVDTIGAGDTFNAAVLAGIVVQDKCNAIGSRAWTELGLDLKNAVEKGCMVAGTKVGMVGFSGLNTLKFH